MPFSRAGRATVRLPRTISALAPPGGRLFALALVTLGLGLLAIASAPMLVGAQTATAQSFAPKDPGVRGGPAGAGGPVSGLSSAQMSFFTEGQDRFEEVDSVAGNMPNEDGVGLGPRFNLNSCAGCHAQPAVGGTSPALNPQVSVAKLHGADNQIPFFVTTNGPVREARFINNLQTGTPDGGVHDLFTIVGRSDAPSGCTATVLPQPNFAAQAAAGNLVFRIPTPTFGAGLVQAISDDTLVENLTRDPRAKGLGISGRLNREGNAGTITRFGWKAQNKSTIIFSGEAYLVEQGVSNEVFAQERGEPGDRGISDRVEPPAVCETNSTPEDATVFGATTVPGAMSDTEGFSLFSTMLAAPTPAPAVSTTAANSIANGFNQFHNAGCDVCHSSTLQTGTSNIAALSNQTIHPFSDFALHSMGTALADGVSQGGAAGDEFRTAPLWGVGQRIFFLHDGRTNDLMTAIKAHAGRGSEANAVINRFLSLSPSSQQDVLNFLRSL